MSQTYSNNQNGFTLAEILAVIAITGILVAVSIPIFTGQLDKVAEKECLANRRTLESAVIAEKLMYPNKTDNEILELAASTMGKTVTGGYVDDLCRKNGKIKVLWYEDGSIGIQCSVHGGNIDKFVKDVTSIVIDGLDTMTRIAKGKTQTLKQFLSTGKSTIDSQAGDTANGANMSWTKAIKDKLNEQGSPLLKQGWALKYDIKTKEYTMIITTDGVGSLVNGKDGDTINVIKYVYSSDKKLVDTVTGTAKIKLYTTVGRYNRIDMTTFKQ